MLKHQVFHLFGVLPLTIDDYAEVLVESKRNNWENHICEGELGQSHHQNRWENIQEGLDELSPKVSTLVNSFPTFADH